MYVEIRCYGTRMENSNGVRFIPKRLSVKYFSSCRITDTNVRTRALALDFNKPGGEANNTTRSVYHVVIALTVRLMTNEIIVYSNFSSVPRGNESKDGRETQIVQPYHDCYFDETFLNSAERFTRTYSANV